MELQIKRIQEEKGINNLMLAERMGVTPQYVGQVAKGSVGASIDKYEQIAEILGVKLWQLFAPKNEYKLTEEVETASQNQNSSHDYQDEKPDLIVIDRSTGRTQNYRLLP